MWSRATTLRAARRSAGVRGGPIKRPRTPSSERGDLDRLRVYAPDQTHDLVRVAKLIDVGRHALIARRADSVEARVNWPKYAIENSDKLLPVGATVGIRAVDISANRNLLSIRDFGGERRFEGVRTSSMGCQKRVGIQM